MNSESLHHAFTGGAPEKVGPPRPSKSRSGWLSGLRRYFMDDTEERWGARLIRISNDMMLVCDEELRILYHNRSFLKGAGYQAGTFVGQSLIDFVPAADRPDVRNTFEFVRTEKGKGARLDAQMMTQRGDRIFDLRIVRSLNRNGKYFFYIVARDETERRGGEQQFHQNGESRFLDDLPVAAWRTDRELRVVDSCGTLWESFDVVGSSLIGLDLSDARCPLTPRFFHQIDYCDAMAGQFLHTTIEWGGETFDATVEPILDSSHLVVGTLGMLRRSKQATVAHSVEHLQITQAVRTVGDLKSTRKVQIGPAITDRLSGKLDVDEHGEDPIALAN